MKVLVKDEYENLSHCIVCYPLNLQNNESDNPQKQVNKIIAASQYNTLINKMIENGTRVEFIDLVESPQQVFARDIGFIIDGILFISNMTDSVRKSETEVLKSLAKNHNIKTHVMQNQAEGGDIIVHHNIIFIGQSNRTNAAAVDEISSVLKDNKLNYDLIKVSFTLSKIHLDCVFNVLDENTCIITGDVFEPENVTRHFSKVIQIPDEDSNLLASNVVQLGNKKILCSNSNFSNILNTNGYNSVFIDFSEIMKCNGSLGCCVFPIYRNSEKD